MARKKPKPILHVKDLKHANAVLAEIAGVLRELRTIETEMQEKIDQIKAEAEQKAAGLKVRLKALEDGLTAFSEYNKEELFKKKKSVELTYGVLGYRKSTSISVKRDTLSLLKEHGFTEAIKIKESVDKDVLHTWPDERLAIVNARRVVKDKFWYEIKQEELKEAA